MHSIRVHNMYAHVYSSNGCALRRFDSFVSFSGTRYNHYGGIYIVNVAFIQMIIRLRTCLGFDLQHPNNGA